VAEADEHTVVSVFLCTSSPAAIGDFCDYDIPVPAPFPCYLKVLILKVKDLKEK